MNRNPVIKNSSYCLIHAPDLIRYGSKPRREIAKNPQVEYEIISSTRIFPEVVTYAPNQAFIGNISPEDLVNIERPWFKKENLLKEASGVGKFGEIMDQEMFYALLKLADVLKPPLFEVSEIMANAMLGLLKSHLLFSNIEIDKFTITPREDIAKNIASGSALGIYAGTTRRSIVGCFNRDNRDEGAEDENLTAHHLLEALCAKASGALALKWLLHREGIGPEKIDFILSCGEEACGDRYQRGGGGMAKAIGEMCGCINASGHDVKNFCAAPASAIIDAACRVKAGLADNVVVVGGGSLAKLGMKMQGFLNHKIPILDDCLASMAFLISRNDGKSPVIQLEPGAVGKAPIGASTSDEAVYRSLILEPLKALKLKIADIDKFAPELQNPEIMEHAGSGDVAKKNYRKIAVMSVIEAIRAKKSAKEKELAKKEAKKKMNSLMKKIEMPGFAPTQGHIPSAVPYLGHATEAMKRGEIKRVMFLAKASLFLSRCTQLFDGISFILEKGGKKC